MPLEQLREQAQALLERALEEFTALARARGREAQGAAARARRRAWKQLVEKVKPRIPQLVAAYQERLAARLQDARCAAALDEDRIRQELVLFAVQGRRGRRAVAPHHASGRNAPHPARSGGAAGKRLDFLMQELNREANTLGSKSVDIDVSQASVELKVLIEQMREQVQNIE